MAALHVLLIVALISQSATVRALLPQVMTVQILQPAHPRKKPPQIEPQLPPVALEIPIPEVNLPPPPVQSGAPRAVARAAPSAPAAAHFGLSTGDAGLGVQVATSAGGGGRARGSLGDFDAAVKRAILARKRQPALRWDVRNTCVINYSVTIAPSGALAFYKIDPCAITEINQAAETAIRAAAPFARPPDLGAGVYTVHGTLIFHP